MGGLYAPAAGAGGLPPLTRNQPSPWSATSSGVPVDCIAPPCMLLSIELSWTPRPTWTAFEPPCWAFGAAPPRWSWESESLNVVRWDLKPSVLTLAMSLDVTSSMVWWTLRPLMAAYMLRIIGASVPFDLRPPRGGPAARGWLPVASRR